MNMLRSSREVIKLASLDWSSMRYIGPKAFTQPLTLRRPYLGQCSAYDRRSTDPLCRIHYLFWQENGRAHNCDQSLRLKWSYYFDQLTARLKWIRVSFMLPISLVLFFFHRLHPASIFHGSNAGARRYSMPSTFRSRRVPAIPF
jgi:hypothetical protein